MRYCLVSKTHGYYPLVGQSLDVALPILLDYLKSRPDLYGKTYKLVDANLVLLGTIRAGINPTFERTPKP